MFRPALNRELSSAKSEVFVFCTSFGMSFIIERKSADEIIEPYIFKNVKFWQSISNTNLEGAIADEVCNPVEHLAVDPQIL